MWQFKIYPCIFENGSTEFSNSLGDQIKVIDAKSDMGQAQLIHRPPDRFTDMSRMLKPQEFKGHVAQRYVVAMQCRLSHLEGIVARAILHGWVMMPSRYGDEAKSFTVEPRRSFHVCHA
jgi:hypothetical protein